MRLHRLLTTMATALLVAACSNTSTTPASGSPAPQRARNFITTEEILTSTTARNAMDAVLQLRPQWLNTRGALSVSGQRVLPVVYLDDLRLGSLDELSTIWVESFRELRYISSTEATTRWGRGVGGGVIQVVIAR